MVRHWSDALIVVHGTGTDGVARARRRRPKDSEPGPDHGGVGGPVFLTEPVASSIAEFIFHEHGDLWVSVNNLGYHRGARSRRTGEEDERFIQRVRSIQQFICSRLRSMVASSKILHN